MNNADKLMRALIWVDQKQQAASGCINSVFMLTSDSSFDFHFCHGSGIVWGMVLGRALHQSREAVESSAVQWWLCAGTYQSSGLQRNDAAVPWVTMGTAVVMSRLFAATAVRIKHSTQHNCSPLDFH